MRPTPGSQARMVIAFASLAHCLHHIITALFLTIVLVLTATWQRPYDELIALWTLGAFLIGAVSPLAGYLSDKFGERPMMIALFFGLGFSSIACGLVESPVGLQAALASMGVFGAIYHPVGTAWVVRHTGASGKAVALVGSAGSVGVALASLVAGLLTDAMSWRAAFIVPGVMALAGGAALLVFGAGQAEERPATPPVPPAPVTPVERTAFRQAVIALVVAMGLTSIVWHAFVTMLPKWLGQELAAFLPPGLGGIGGLVTAVFLIGVLAQFAGGALADRGLVKQTYVASFLLKLLAFLFALSVGGWPVLIAAVVVVWVFDIAAPLENILVARFSPPGRAGLAYGVRFGFSTISAPLGVQMVAWLYDGGSKGFATLLWVLAAMAAAILLAATLIPADEHARPSTAAAAPSEASPLPSRPNSL